MKTNVNASIIACNSAGCANPAVISTRNYAWCAKCAPPEQCPTLYRIGKAIQTAKAEAR